MAREVLAQLDAWGADLSFHDPFVDEIDEHGVRLHRRELTEDLVRSADAVLLLTPHATYDLEALADQAGLPFDARNATGMRDRPNVEVL